MVIEKLGKPSFTDFDKVMYSSTVLNTFQTLKWDTRSIVPSIGGKALMSFF